MYIFSLNNLGVISVYFCSVIKQCVLNDLTTFKMIHNNVSTATADSAIKMNCCYLTHRTAHNLCGSIYNSRLVHL